jgi:nitric oxide reductase activation protein
MDVAFAFHSTYKPESCVMTISHYWSRLNDPEKIGAMKSDVYLKAGGQAHFTDFDAVRSYEKAISSISCPSFARQLFALMEDLRLEEKLLQQRPGMIYGFENRRLLLARRFREAYHSSKSSSAALDILFSGIYLQWIHKPVVFPGIISSLKPAVRQLVKKAAEAESTHGIVALCLHFISLLPNHYPDMQSSFFTIESEEKDKGPSETLDERKDAIDGKDKEQSDNDEDEPNEEKLPTWHSEDKEDEEGFLQFDLNEGQKMDLMGEGEREADSGDQALASVEGSAQDSDAEDYDEKETKNSLPQQKASATFIQPGKANRFAQAFYLPKQPISNEDQLSYRTYRSAVEPIERPLKRSIQKTIEHKLTAPRNALHAGRLGKKLLPVLTEELPRLFYKKNQEASEWDAAFSLLVDCSASMYDKMDQLKAGLVLFHETLYALKIPHAITGFYEDALSSSDIFQPNYFHEIMTFEESHFPGNGAAIMQLEPEDDNRDGFALRKIGVKLKRAQV